MALTIYIIMIVRSLRQRDEDADKLVKELQGKWDTLETIISSLVEESNQARIKPQPAAIEYIPVPMENCNPYRGLPNSSNLC